MGKARQEIDGLTGIYGEYPTQIATTIPARYLNFIKQISRIREDSSISHTIRHALVKEFGIPKDEEDEIRMIEEAQSAVMLQKKRELQAHKDFSILQAQAQLQVQNSEE